MALQIGTGVSSKATETPSGSFSHLIAYGAPTSEEVVNLKLVKINVKVKN